MNADKAKIISLVPSWTETLVAAGVNVVGRTRFCIHPDHIAKNIPTVGGTKALDIEKIKHINPDYILVDKQENTLEMAEEIKAAGFKMFITDVTDFSSVIGSLKFLSRSLENEALNDMANRYQAVSGPGAQLDPGKFFLQSVLKGAITELNFVRDYAYVIWKNPFMVVGDTTFIAENYNLVGIEFKVEQKYPQVDEQSLRQKFCFFSSEPFPFLDHYDALIQQGFKGVVVDGEKLSWYGIRNLRFLEACLK
ncbi:MAG: hypothetical protein H7256_07435 [Bdellovibrio sp.]|nr:hypothetical protein [Bdellovibrio sp.]